MELKERLWDRGQAFQKAALAMLVRKEMGVWSRKCLWRGLLSDPLGGGASHVHLSVLVDCAETGGLEPDRCNLYSVSTKFARLRA